MRRGLAALLCASLLGLAAPAEAAAELTVCLDANLPPWSAAHGIAGGGFDAAVARAVAARLDRTLTVLWFESSLDEDASSTLAANALLSDGKCQLVGGYPLIADSLGKPGLKTARLPDFAGATRADRGRRVQLGTLVASKPYHRAALVILLGATTKRPVASLADLQGLKLGVEEGTLADTVLSTYADGKLVPAITHLVPGREHILARLEQGDFDAAMVQLRRFDAWRAAHPGTRIRLSDYRYRIGFNIGFVGLSSETALLEAVDRAILDLAAQHEIAALAKDAGVTYVPPSGPDVLEHLTIRDITQE